ncbi:hypothetical protein N9N28_12940 [Rubripirellula amarantea]|nr:hypothetical protein [Rubripirellula amarantea]
MNRAINRAAAGANIGFLLFMLAGPLYAATPSSETLLPASTVAYVSVASPTDLEERLKRTQLGQFAQDPSLKPFVDHLRDTIPQRLGDIEQRVGVSLEDLENIASGELAWAIVGRETGRAASVLLVDTTGNKEERDKVLNNIDEYLVGLKATKSADEVAGIAITKYDVPPQGEDEKARTAAYFVHNDLLCVADHSEAVTELAARVANPPKDTVGSLEEYTGVMAKCHGEAEAAKADIRWFLRPFPLVDAMRTIRPRTREGEDRVEQLRGQGFDAVKGIGGLVSVASDAKYDFIHRTAIYAPPVQGAADGKKYLLGMNIFQTPNNGELTLHNWTPRVIARYTTVNIDLLNAFDNVDSLFDTMIAGYEGAFETAMNRFKDDPFGPRIDFRNEIVASLGSRLCAMTDYTLPIETDSERFLLAIDVKGKKIDTLKVAIGKYLEKDGYIKKELEGREIWEFQPEEEEEFDIGLNDGGLVPMEAIEDEEDKRLLTRSAVCVTDGQLFIASDVEFLRLAFKQATENESLAESYDYQAVAAALAVLAPGKQCSWSFTRTDESIRPTYVLLREGRLPQSESFFARLLNELLTTPADQKNQLLRKQKLDGSDLPSYELARRYFGPSGRTVRADEDGWLITGVMLNKAEN